MADAVDGISTASFPDQGNAEAHTRQPQLSLLPVRFTKTVHFIRHGEGYHNVAGHADPELYRDEDYFDAHLTELGWRQAHALGHHIHKTKLKVDLVVTSTLTRSIETAVGAFALAQWQADVGGVPLMVAQSEDKGRVTAHPAMAADGVPKFVSTELCREHLGVHPCDRRRSRTFLRDTFPGVDFGEVEDEEDVQWSPTHRETHDEITSRGRAFMQWLYSRPEQHIAVVSHSSLLRHTLASYADVEAPSDVQQHLLQYFENCEMRSMVLTDAARPPADTGRDPYHWPGGLHNPARGY